MDEEILKGDDMDFNKKHYHITVVCESIFIEPQMTKSFLEAVMKYNDAIGILKDQQGLEVKSRGINVTTFNDKSTVKYRECWKNCMENRNGH